jgi:hypothetical protein
MSIYTLSFYKFLEQFINLKYFYPIEHFHVTEQVGPSYNAADFCSGYDRFEPLTVYRFFGVFS